MTSPYLTPTAVPAISAAAAPRRSVGRALFAGVVIALGVAGAVIAAFIAAITWTGCFLACTGENHLGGALIGLIAAVSLASGPAAVSGLYRSARWMRAAAWVLATGAALMLIGLATA